MLRHRFSHNSRRQLTYLAIALGALTILALIAWGVATAYVHFVHDTFCSGEFGQCSK
jgi:hypothetical protein